MTASERGEKCRHIVNAVYSELYANGLLTTRNPQSLIKAVICEAVIDALYPNQQIDVPSWRDS